MCGITGFLHFDKLRSADPAKLKKMTDLLVHRGPDGEGFHVNDNLALGHRRLSILDLNSGSQPMYSRDGQVVVVFNGEIYNYIELRKELEALGIVFQTESDTEVIIAAYQQWGRDCQNKFNGMWAFALWDNREELLLLSRDRLGEKPLHYTTFDNTLIFGSEMKAIFGYGVPKNITLDLLEVYLIYTYIPEPYTFYKDIYKLEAGHCLVVQGGHIKKSQYWDVPLINEADPITNKQEVYDTFSELLTDSVRIRMRSDVPFGAFLSGGLDSSSIVSLMSQHSNHPVNTFTIGFEEAAFDESKLAKMVADQYKTEHTRGTVTPEDFDETLLALTHHFDEPFGDSSAIPTGQVSKLARQKVKMTLTGDGGDEALSGYNSFLGLKISQKINDLPSALTGFSYNVMGMVSNISKGGVRYKLNKARSVLTTSKLPFEERMLRKKPFADYDLIKKLTAGVDQKSLVPIEEYFAQLNSRVSYQDDFYRMVYLSIKHELPNDYLVKVDRMSMANSLETRAPFLDYRLIEYMMRVHKNVKLQGWERKSVLRKTVAADLPKPILNAQKRGFGVPLREWFKQKEFVNRLTEMSEVNRLLDTDAFREVIELNESGQRDHGNFIWALLMLNQQLT